MATSPVLLALVKGVEYGCLGLLVGWIGGRAGAGLAVGPVFGGAILAFGASPGPVPTADLVPQGLSELPRRLFPRALLRWRTWREDAIA